MPDLKATATFRGDGVTKKFYFGFDYISPEFIYVSVGGTLLQYPADYEVFDKSVELHIAPSVEELIRIYRQTPTSRIIQWADGSFVKASQMELENIQTLHLIEEAKDYIIQNLKATQDVEYYSTLAKTWAMATTSPDEETDTDSTTGKTQSSKSWSLYSKERAIAAAGSANSASINATVAQHAQDLAQTAAESAQGVLEDVKEVAKDVNVFVPDMSSDGTLTWTNKAGLENPEPVNLMGPQGATGPQGPQGIQGPKGDKGDKGDTGESGVQIETNAFCVFSIRNGHLICTYQDGQEQPNFSINDAGHLIYTI